MKLPFFRSALLTFLTLSLVRLQAAEPAPQPAPAPAPTPEKKSMRVLAAPERRVIAPRDGERKVEMETVAFLGVETQPVSAAMAAQLGLARGTGLIVNHIVPKSPAADVLNEYDVLLNLDDQILIETRQLAVLIRLHKEGDEIGLTYLRAGKKTTTRVKLGKTDVPKNALGGAWGTPPGARFEMLTSPGGEPREIDHVLSMMQGAHNGDPVRIQIERNGGPGFRAMTLNTGNSNLVFSDDKGSLELSLQNGKKRLVARDPKGAEIYSGPVTTPEERRALPPELRERLEHLEAMHDVTFRTDGDFKGVESKVAHPRGISFPQPAPAPRAPTSAPGFF